MTDATTLVLISGPVASGKTTLAWNVAALARASGEPAAAIDMDELTEMAGGTDWTQIQLAHRRHACGLAGALIDRLAAQGTRFVAVAGSTLSPHEWAAVLDNTTVSTQPIRLRLRVSIAQAVRRAQSDPTRVLTSDPVVVRRLHDAINWEATDTPDLEVATDDLSANEVAELVMAYVRSTRKDG